MKKPLNTYDLTITEPVGIHLFVQVRAANLLLVYRALCKEYGRLYRCSWGYINTDVVVRVYSKSIHMPMRTKR